MKGHIAFCPHFHQPHFQLHKTRNEAFVNSYLPWMELLQEAVKLDKFYINLHFSGPFLYWLQDQKSDYLTGFKYMLSSNKIGIIGGLADEPFIQLSSRRDDFLYQLKKYNELMSQTLGVSAEQWQGIHLVERECGEMVLNEISYAAGLMNAVPIFYLDAETFYESHFSYPGSESDYCLKHFGFSDPFSKTTISHMPQELLYFALSDEIGGQPFYAMPVHSQFRYKLLKRQGFTIDDHKRVKPQHYYFYIKDVLEKAAQMVQVYGKPELEPIVVIFEDAEKFGQWSKDPKGDTEWLLEFFRLVEQDEEIAFTGLKDYFDRQGFLDTYPVKSSHSYKEWENWTARRGIRGVTFGDERLRRVICRLRDIESEQTAFEEALLTDYVGEKFAQNGQTAQDQIIRALMQSAERFDMVKTIIKEKYSPETINQYETVNRVRNLVYQEDPKWASRHPSYGSSPYYDMYGLAYLELACRMMSVLISRISHTQRERFTLRDWNLDGKKEIVIEEAGQFLVIDTRGGCICFHHVLDPVLAEDMDQIQSLITEDIGSSRIKAYNTIFKHSFPLVFTETDSSMGLTYYAEGGRQEICKNSWRCELYWEYEDQVQSVGSLQSANFILQDVTTNEKGVSVTLTCPLHLKVADQILEVLVTKSFQTGDKSLKVSFAAEVNGQLDVGQLLFVPHIVTSATPSDEVDFKPHTLLGIKGKDIRKVEYKVNEISVSTDGGMEYKKSACDLESPGRIDYVCKYQNGEGKSFHNLIRFEIVDSGPMQNLVIEPAVKNYYKDYVFEGQSRLGYHSSGLAIMPALAVTEGKAFIEVVTSWEFDYAANETDYDKICHLIETK